MNDENTTHIWLNLNQFKKLMRHKYLQTQVDNRWYYIRLERPEVQLFDKDGKPVCASKVRKLLPLMRTRRYTKRKKKGANDEKDR